MWTLALIDYGSGNLHSAERALRRAAQDARKTPEIKVTSDPDALSYADRIVLPGVGHFKHCIESLQAVDGLVDALHEAVITHARPFFGICVGMQLLAEKGLEDGETDGLGWIDGRVERIDAPGLRIPHVGWNSLEDIKAHPVMQDLEQDAHVYFTHSYVLKNANPDEVVAHTDYGAPLVAAVAKDTLFATQFHPEKSQKTGLKILSNFMKWRP